MGLRSLHDDDRLQQLGRGLGSGERVGLDLVAASLEQLCHFCGMWGDDQRPSRERTASACGRRSIRAAASR